MGTYEYDLWGRPVSVNATADDTDNITGKNPYRYRGYYYDKETGFYYLTARYYDPQIRRFISADSMNALMIATTDVTCKNLFVYAENNPVTNKDSSGNFVDMVFDVISLAGSIADVIKKPNDPLAWACLAGDAADVLIPGVSGIGEVIRGAKAVAIVAETAKVASGAGAVAEGAIKAKKAIGNLVDGVKSFGKKYKSGKSSGADDIIQYEKLKSQYAASEIINAERIGSGLKSDPYHRAASFIPEEQLANGRTFSFTNGDGRKMTMLQTEGELNEVAGIYEYILNPQGQVEHQLFKAGAGVLGPR